MGEGAAAYWTLALKARAYLDELSERYQIDAQYCPGLLHAVHRPRYLAEAPRPRGAAHIASFRYAAALRELERCARWSQLGLPWRVSG